MLVPGALGYLFTFSSSITLPGSLWMATALRQNGAIAPRPVVTRSTQHFKSAEEAWFWTMAALTARREGARYTAGLGRIERPCEPDDVIKCLDQLYRRRRIDLVHARILRIWGERGTAPNPAHTGERCDWKIWREAMDRLEWPLRVKGIVG